MATDDLQILVTGQASAPAGFLIPGNGQIKPKAMNAVFDGTNAAGDFTPALEIISDAGIVVARVAAATVTAGSSAEVTWAPFLEGPSAAAATATVEWFYASRVTSLTLSPSATTYIPWTATQTSNASLFSLGNTHGLNTTVEVAQAGVCLVSFYVIQHPFNAAWPMHLFLNSTNAAEMGAAGYNRMNSTDGVDPVTRNPYQARDYRVTVARAAPFEIFAEAVNDDVASQTLDTMEMGIVWWPSSALFV